MLIVHVANFDLHTFQRRIDITRRASGRLGAVSQHQGGAEDRRCQILPIEAGTFYVMDRSYLDFCRLFKMHQAGAFFVTRAKRGMNARRVYSSKIDRTTGIICDQAIRLEGFYVSKDYPEHLQRIRYKDPESGKTFVFLTNNTTLQPLTIAALYKNRWQVELFFKGSNNTCASNDFWGRARMP